MTNRIISLMLLFCGLTFIETFAHENNFSISVKVTQGIEDAGYLVHIFNNDKTQRKFVDKITVTDKRTSFETHIDEPLVGTAPSARLAYAFLLYLASRLR